MKRIYGALSPFDHKKVCYTWQEVKKELDKCKYSKSDKSNTNLNEAFCKHEFRIMKSVMLRKNLEARLNRRFPNWFSEELPKKNKSKISYAVYDQDKLNCKKERFLEMGKYFINNYLDENFIWGCIDIFILGHLIFRSNHDYYIEPKITWTTEAKFLDERAVLTERFKRNSLKIGNLSDGEKTYRLKPLSQNRPIIYICNSISKAELIKFIDKEWPNLFKITSTLGESSEDARIPSIQDLRIIELKDCLGMTFKNIASVIIDEFKLDDPDAKINEDSIKTIYHRTHKRLTEIIPER